MVRGYQGPDNDMARPDRVMATVKHFAGYGLSARDYGSVEVSPSSLHSIMVPFKAAVDAGVGSLMVSFNTINNIPATVHQELLHDVLRKDWRFDGLAVTDFTAILEVVNHAVVEDLKEASYLSFKTGITTDMVSEGFMRYLPELVAEGKVSEEEIDTACRRVLEAKYKLGLFADPFMGMNEALRKSVTLTPEHRALAREAVAKSCVLLENKNSALPLKKDGKTIALIGPLADSKINMQGTWSVAAEPETSITLLEGMQNALGKGSRVLHAKGANIVNDPNVAARLNVFNPHDKPASIDERSPEKMIKEALKIAKKSDTIVLCLGEAKEHAGEAATRQDITIPQDQRPLFDTMAKYAKKSGKKLILVTMSGRPLALTHEAQHADAILQAWHPGTEAGNGIADILFGDANPSARLSVAFPRHVGQLPLKTEQLPTGRPAGNAPAQADGDQEVNEKGNRIFQKFTTSCIIEGPHTPLYPAGYGLSYTDFSYSAPQVNKTQLAGEGDVLEISFTLKNTGARAGEETPQLYIRDLVASISRPVLELKGFQKVKLEPGEERSVTFRITPDDLKFYNARTISDYTYDWEGGAFDIMVGPNSRDLQTLRVNWAKQPAPEATLAPEVK
ncbi:MAG: glycoside hydrolase family 3 C-terminal domain-containing protein [Alphaproteobacteria bacterium]|nr:glycoside hydrolase family 3 C-terminal domain-containing protein [Alphaproteobacteria bacterium]